VYSWADKKPDQLELTIEDETLEGVLVEALVALGDLLTEERGGEGLEHRIDVVANDLSGLLARWLSELIRLAEVDGFVPERVVEAFVDEGRAVALVFGQRLGPQTAVRAVSDCRLEPSGAEHGWRARVVLDT
jgi:SHS2 domain-containing protein